MSRAQAGEKRERPIVQVATPTVDAEGQPVKSWATFDTIWASVDFLYGSELEAMQKINSSISVKFTTHYRTDILVTHRLSWRSEFWNILAILPESDKFDMVLACSKVE